MSIQPPVCVAVTGTNGKTSTTHFLHQIWQGMGLSSASLGTLGLITPHPVQTDEALSLYTTPDNALLKKTLYQCAKQGITHIALEASSHGLHQGRLNGISLSGAAFTYLGRDHLDYHKTPDAYLEAKYRLFTQLLPQGKPGIVCINKPNDPIATRFIQATSHAVTVGTHGHFIRLLETSPLCFETNNQLYTSHFSPAGFFQASNLLTALALAIHVPPFPKMSDLLPILPHVQPVPGRLEPVAPSIYIDYAHTPDALEKVLMDLRTLTPKPGKLIVVFGCGGERDIGKRPIMGALAHKLTDVVIVTDDNPRHEDPNAIRAAILASCPGGYDMGDRRRAIEMGIRLHAPGDTLLIAGKGCETFQHIAGQKIPFSDKDVVYEFINHAPS